MGVLTKSSRPRITVNVLPKIPATLHGVGGIAVSKIDGVWTVEPHWQDLSLVPPGDLSTKEVWIRDTNSGAYARMLLSGVGGGGGGGGGGGAQSVIDFGAVGDGVTDDRTAFNDALATGKPTFVPSGTYFISDIIDFVAGGALFGEGWGSTILKFPQGVNCVHLHDYVTMRDLTIDGTAVNDVLGNSGVLFLNSSGLGVTGAICARVRVRNIGFQGFAFIGSSGNWMIDCIADTCGHRGINMSQLSCKNHVVGFHAHNCWRSGVLLGYGCDDNIFENCYMDGELQSVGGFAFSVGSNCARNIFSNFVIGPQQAASGTTCPKMLIGAGTQDSVFSNFTINGAGSRAIYIWSTDLDSVALGLGLVNRDTKNNIFTDFTINGTSVAASYAVGINEQTTSPSFTINNNRFDNFYINAFTTGLHDVAGSRPMTGANNSFSNIKFGTITTETDIPAATTPRYWGVGTTTNSVPNRININVASPGVALAIKNGAKISGRDAADSADLTMLQVDSGNYLNVGIDNFVAIRINRNMVPGIDATYALGNDTLQWNGLSLAPGASIGFGGTSFKITENTGNIWMSTATDQAGIVVENTNPGPNGAFILLYGNSATPANFDTVGSIYFDGKNLAATPVMTSYGLIACSVTSFALGAEEARFVFNLREGGAPVNEMQLDGVALAPFASGGLTLGKSTLPWGGVYLASGAAINFASGDVTVTHQTDKLNFQNAANGYTFDAYVSIGTTATGTYPLYIENTLTGTMACAIRNLSNAAGATTGFRFINDAANYLELKITSAAGSPANTAIVGGSTSVATILQSATTARITLDVNGNVVIGTAAIATSATNGFFYLEACAGIPSGTPTAYAGRIPFVYDSTNNNLYAYNGAWKKVAMA